MIEVLHKFIIWPNKYKQYKVYKKEIYKELILIAWHPLRWWDWCSSKHEKIKKKIGF